MLSMMLLPAIEAGGPGIALRPADTFVVRIAEVSAAVLTGDVQTLDRLIIAADGLHVLIDADAVIGAVDGGDDAHRVVRAVVQIGHHIRALAEQRVFARGQHGLIIGNRLLIDALIRKADGLAESFKRIGLKGFAAANASFISSYSV